MKTILLLAFLFPALHAGAQTRSADTLYQVYLPNQDVQAERIWANDTVRYHYNQMKYYVTTILPYLNAATELFNEVHATLVEGSLEGKERRQYIKAREEALRIRFEQQVKSLNETQGVLLIRLIGRQTGLNLYQCLQELKGPVSSIRWQAWARLHGFNLNQRYRPEEQPDLERIMRSLGYPLPACYQPETVSTSRP